MHTLCTQYDHCHYGALALALCKVPYAYMYVVHVRVVVLYECREFSVAPVVMKFNEDFLRRQLFTRNLSCLHFD